MPRKTARVRVQDVAGSPQSNVQLSFRMVGFRPDLHHGVGGRTVAARSVRGLISKAARALRALIRTARAPLRAWSVSRAQRCSRRGAARAAPVGAGPESACSPRCARTCTSRDAPAQRPPEGPAGCAVREDLGHGHRGTPVARLVGLVPHSGAVQADRGRHRQGTDQHRSGCRRSHRYRTAASSRPTPGRSAAHRRRQLPRSDTGYGDVHLPQLGNHALHGSRAVGRRAGHGEERLLCLGRPHVRGRTGQYPCDGSDE